MKTVFAAGLSYKTSPVALREKHAVAPADQVAVARQLKETRGLDEVVLLWTCNRVEIYGVAENPRENLPRMLECLAGKRIHAGGVYCHEERDAVRHLFGVTSGMDSMVLGESEIANQVKQAYEQARAAGLTGKMLNRIFQKAFETAKEVRRTTAIGRGAASVGSIAVQHARKNFGPGLSEKRIMVIGAGNMAEKCLRHLVKHGSSGIVVVNRSMDRAEKLAKEYGGAAVPFGRCLDAMADIDIVITSTGCPDVIIERRDIETVMASRPGRPLVIIDIAVPRDVDPQSRTIPNVHLCDIDDLQGIVKERISHRAKDLALCRSIIEARTADVLSRIHAVAAQPEKAECR